MSDKKQRMRVKYDVEALVITFEVVDASGPEDKVLVTRDFEFNQLPKDGDNRDKVTLYGLNKLLTDRTSEQKDKLLKLDEMQVVFELLCFGEWAKERVVGAIVVSPEVEALAQMQSISVPDVQAALAQYDKGTRKAILDRDDVQSVAKLIRAARKDAPAKTLDDMIPEAK